MRALGRAGAGALRSILALLLGLIVLVLAGAGAVAWRLSDGPLDVTWLVPRIAPALAPGWSAQQVTVALVRQPGGHDLHLEATAAQHGAGPGGPDQSARSASVDLALAPLLRGQLIPGRVVADGLRLRLAFPRADSPGGDTDWQGIADRLQQVDLTDAEATVADVAMGQSLTVRVAAATVTREPDGILHGHAAAEATAGGATMQAEADGSYGPEGGQVEVTVPAANPATLARAVPALAAAATLDADLTVHATLAFGPGGTVTHATVHAEAGPGTAQLPAKGGGTSPGHFASATLDAEGTPAHLDLRALRLVLAPPSGSPPTTVTVSGAADRAAGRFTAQLAIAIDRLAFADLGSLWPERVGGGARQWLSENLTAGAAHDGRAAFTLTGADTGEDVDLTQADGSLVGDDVTIWWLRPVPPIQHANAIVQWQTPDTALVTVTSGREGGVEIKGGAIRVTGLTGHDQVATIDADLAGPLADVLGVLKHPRLNLLSKHPVPLDAPAGAVTAHLSVRLPLESKVSIDQVAIHAKGQVANLHLGGVAGGRDLDRGQLAFDVTNDGLSIKGPADFAHIPTQLALTMDFKDGPKTQVLQHVTAALRLTKADADRAGLGALGLEGGALAASVDYAERRDGTSTIQLDADLKEARLATPLGWSKAAGTPGHAEAQALLDHGRLVGLERLRAEAPGLAVVARSELVNGRPSVVHLERGEIGRSSATGTIVLPQNEGDPYRVTLSGPRLDLEGRLGSLGDGPATPAKAADSGPAYAVDLRFERVALGPNRSLGAVTLTAASNGHHITHAHLATGGMERARADLTTVPGGRHLSASAADLGSLLRDTGVLSDLSGGTAVIEGAFEDRVAGAPFSGTFDLRGFKVQGAPAAGKLLQALTLYGIVDALRGPGLVFDRFETPFRLQGSVLDVQDARAFSSSLGLTATGQVDFGRKLLALQGTIVPAYFFNSLPGRIPLIGRMFSPEKGSGVFAANYSLHGPMADPAISVNPLSALTPGFARKFFDLFQ